MFFQQRRYLDIKCEFLTRDINRDFETPQSVKLMIETSPSSDAAVGLSG